MLHSMRAASPLAQPDGCTSRCWGVSVQAAVSWIFSNVSRMTWTGGHHLALYLSVSFPILTRLTPAADSLFAPACRRCPPPPPPPPTTPPPPPHHHHPPPGPPTTHPTHPTPPHHHHHTGTHSGQEIHRDLFGRQRRGGRELSLAGSQPLSRPYPPAPGHTNPETPASQRTMAPIK